MKNVKLLLAFAAGVAITLALTGKFPGIHGFNLANWSLDGGMSLDGGIVGTLGLIVLIVVAAYLTARPAPQSTQQDAGAPQGRAEEFFQFLKNLKASRTDLWLGGVCGGLGERTGVPAWVWRLGFAVAIVYNGSGLLAYVLLWIFLPLGDKPGASKHGSFLEFLRSLKRSSTDRWLGGVCGGLAELTSAPAWVWRLGFAVLTVGALLPYVLLWIFVPSDEAKQTLTA